MPRQVIKPGPEQCLQRLLAALEHEMLQATDEEVRDAVRDLGIDPDMKGSIAWVGITFPAKMRMEDVFDLKALRKKFQARLTVPKKSE